MSLIKSISGIRGTIGGLVGDNLTPLDTVKFATAYSIWLKKKFYNQKKLKIVIGRDARLSGKIISDLVSSTVNAMGIDVIEGGLSTTPTIEMAVIYEKAHGGIVLTASHNPKEWNALKLLNEKGEFISEQEGKELLLIASNEKGFSYTDVNDLGKTYLREDFILKHINDILKLELVKEEIVKQKKYKIVLDSVNSTGGISVPLLLEKMGCKVVKLFCDPSGDFPHNPEPLEKNLIELSERIIKEKADLGISVDPDVDRLVFFDENGKIFGEEYTLVSVADYILENKKGPVVSNLSSSRALRDIADNHGVECYYSPVGEVNVVEKMKENKAVIGGEGNGGIIYPDLHYGRDALVGIGLFLTNLANKNIKVSQLRKKYPNYYMAKEKIEIKGINIDRVLDIIRTKYIREEINIEDGIKINFKEKWAHLRKSNTEPIIRIYTEAKTQQLADSLASEIIDNILVIK